MYPQNIIGNDDAENSLLFQFDTSEVFGQEKNKQGKVVQNKKRKKNRKGWGEKGKDDVEKRKKE